MEEYTINLGHHIQLHNTSVLSTEPRYMYCIIWMTIEIELHPNNVNKEYGFGVSKSWKPLICPLKEAFLTGFSRLFLHWAV
jgi:hypothetical protein